MELITLILAGTAAVLALVSVILSAKKNDTKQIEKLLAEQDKRLTERMALERKALSEELGKTEERICARFGEVSRINTGTLVETQKTVSEITARNFAELRQSVETKLLAIQTDNAKKLEEMRATVDEKLSATLNTRLNESFKQVSERLEAVYKGLGEMQALAGGVGDLKRMLSNVKTRGTWGEAQLGNLLEQVLSPQQYKHNVCPKPRSKEIVEYAIVLPGKDENEVLLPIDSKFPIESYSRLTAASEAADVAAVELASKELQAQIRLEAKKISDKYVAPPYTTDFAIMFLPIEGLYAEVTRNVGLCEEIQQNNRVVVAGPSTLAALLNSLQMGFTTLAIQKRSSEVWQLLAAFKSQFGKFTDILAKTKKKMEEATKTIGDAEKRTQIIGSKLKDVENMGLPEADEAIGLPEADEEEDEA